MNLFDYFKNSAERHSQRVALVVDGLFYTYDELFQKVNQLAHAIDEEVPRRIGIFASRSLSNYTGILATLACGKTYVPLNVKFPPSRNRLIAKMADVRVLVVNERVLNQIKEMADDLPEDMVLICPEVEKGIIPEIVKDKFKIYDKAYFSEIKKQELTLNVADVKPSKNAYIIFTSGSTGVPKGVPVSHNNVISLIDYLTELYDIGPEDRCSQFSDLTFDLSVQDMFLAWAGGASLYIVPEKVLFGPAKFIKTQKLTVWFSAPSVIHLLKRFKMLKPDVFPNLRYSFFCGEALSKSLAIAWQEAASNSIVENIYGPAETTIGISRYRLPKNPDKILAHHGIVSIGHIYNPQEFCLINKGDEKVDGYGELCLSGSQVFKGYWNNPEKTAERFVTFPGDEKNWYKTGDIVNYKDGNIFFISRKDFMVKIRGNYVELEEINLAVQEFSNREKVYTLPHPMSDGIATNLYCFLPKDGRKNFDKITIFTQLKKKFPDFMIPKDFIFIDKFPLNSNGKIDRKQLIQKLK